MASVQMAVQQLITQDALAGPPGMVAASSCTTEISDNHLTEAVVIFTGDSSHGSSPSQEPAGTYDMWVFRSVQPLPGRASYTYSDSGEQ